MNKKLDNLSNSELRLKLKSLENEYEKLKIDITNQLKHMEELDKEYVDVKKLLNKRTKGKDI